MTARRTSARPSPRPTGPGGLVVTPGSKARSSTRAGDRDRRRARRWSPWSPSSSSATVSVPSRSGPSASSALSIRLPTIVASSVGGNPAHRRAPGSTCSVTPRSRAFAVLPSSSATSTGSSIPSPSRPSRSCAEAASEPASSTASSVRPSSTRPAITCSRFAASWVWARRASASAFVAPSSRASVSTSVRSRSVTTVPSAAAVARRRRATRRAGRGRRRSAACRRRAPPGRARCAEQLLGVVVDSAGRPCSSNTTTPSRSACSVASWWAYSVVISCGSSPSVWRLTRRASSRLSALPKARISAASPITAGQQRGDLVADRVREHADRDQRDHSPVSRTGTTARTERPSVPWWSP